MQSILNSIEDEVLNTELLDELAASLSVPSRAYVRAAASLAGRAAVQEAVGTHSPLSNGGDANGAPVASLDETLRTSRSADLQDVSN